MELALQLIKEAKEQRLTSLDLGNCGLTELPDELFELTWLEELMLSNSEYTEFDEETNYPIHFGGDNQGKNNNIAFISTKISSLNNLKKLIITGEEQFDDDEDGKFLLSDITALSSLIQLQSLDLSLTNVKNIDSLEKMVKLIKLDLGSTFVSDISALEKLVNLNKLNLASTRVSNVNALTKLTKLHTLNLYNTKVIDIGPLEKMAELRWLRLSSTQLINISPLKKLAKLSTLELSSTQVLDISALKDMPQLQTLDLISTQVQDISALKDMPQLQTLYLGSTPVQDISALKDMPQLQLLYLGSTQVQDISALKDMPQLQTLYLNSTQIQDISALKNMTQLQRLDLDSTQVQDISALKELFKKENFRISVNNCLLPKPLLAAIKKGNKGVLNYFNKPKQYLYEARVLILGEPRAGKTTLRRKLKSTSAPMPLPTESTKAFDIEIDPYNCDIEIEGKKQKMKYHLWDFGGQDYYRLLHQLFVAEQSVYVIVTDTDKSKNEEEIDFWLDTIQRLGKDRQGGYSPVIVFQNPKTNREGGEFGDLKKRYPFWKQPEQFIINLDKIAVNNTENFDKQELDKFNHFKKYLEESFCQLPHVGKEMPTEWINIRKVLDKKQKDNWISVEDFGKICTSKGMTDLEEQDDLLDIFRTLGFLLHYKDTALKGMVILNKEWVTDALYRVLDDGIVKANNGWFRKQDAEKIWFEPQYKNRTEELLALMKEFKMSYFNEVSKKYIVPVKLPDTIQGLPEWNNADNVHLRLQYDWLPRAIATQLIVSLHEYLVEFNNGEQWIWRGGAVLDGRRLELKHTQVLIEDNWRENRIDITARGAHSEFLMREVMKNWREVHRPFEDKTEVIKMILCACSICDKAAMPHSFKYENVLNALQKKKKLQCNESFEDFSPSDILRGVFDSTTVSVDEFEKNGGKISEELKNLIASGNLEEALNQLKNDKVITLLKNQFVNLKQDKMRNTLTYSDAQREETKISNALLQYLDEGNNMERITRDHFNRMIK